MFSIDDELKAYIESGVAAMIGTADAAGKPGLLYAWGPRVGDDRSHVSVFLETERAAAVMANLAATGQIALTVTSPVTYRSVQLKGQYEGRGEATPEDYEWVQRQREAFLTETSLVGDPPQTIANLWMDDLFRIDFAVERAFNQTPGPDAGQPL